MLTYFTFGTNHIKKNGESLGMSYCTVEAPSEAEARELMWSARGNRWAFSYPTPELAGVDRFNLKHVSLNEISLDIA